MLWQFHQVSTYGVVPARDQKNERTETEMNELSLFGEITFWLTECTIRNLLMLQQGKNITVEMLLQVNWNTET